MVFSKEGKNRKNVNCSLNICQQEGKFITWIREKTQNYCLPVKSGMLIKIPKQGIESYVSQYF